MKERIDRHKERQHQGQRPHEGRRTCGILAVVQKKGGTKMRSGCFENGKQVGESTTYDAEGKIVKVTKMKSPR